MVDTNTASSVVKESFCEHNQGQENGCDMNQQCQKCRKCMFTVKHKPKHEDDEIEANE